MEEKDARKESISVASIGHSEKLDIVKSEGWAKYKASVPNGIWSRLRGISMTREQGSFGIL